MSDVDYLDLDDLLEMVRLLRIGPVRDVGLLDSAVHRPQSSAFGVDAYPTLALKAGALLHSIVSNHALADGNKRLGWLATMVFLDLNEAATTLDDQSAFQLVMDVAAGRLDAPEIAEQISIAG